MSDITGTGNHAGREAMPDWSGGTAHGGDETNGAEEETETTDAAHAITNEETIAPTSD